MCCTSEVANLLDIFFKGLNECGVVTDYSIQLQIVIIEITVIIKIKNLVNELMTHFEVLYCKELTRKQTDSRINNLEKLGQHEDNIQSVKTLVQDSDSGLPKVGDPNHIQNKSTVIHDSNLTVLDDCSRSEQDVLSTQLSSSFNCDIKNFILNKNAVHVLYTSDNDYTSAFRSNLSSLKALLVNRSVFPVSDKAKKGNINYNNKLVAVKNIILNGSVFPTDNNCDGFVVNKDTNLVKQIEKVHNSVGASFKDHGNNRSFKEVINSEKISKLKCSVIPDTISKTKYKKNNLLTLENEIKEPNSIRDECISTKQVENLTGTTETKNVLDKNELVSIEINKEKGVEENSSQDENILHIIVETTAASNSEVEFLKPHKNKSDLVYEKPHDYNCTDFNTTSRVEYEIGECHIKEHKLPQCSICQQGFSSLEELQCHCEKLHEGVSCLVCKCCQKSFISEADLLKHSVDNEHKKNKFKCMLCDKLFVTKLGLKRHINSHRGKKTATCDVCGKSFGRTDCLQVHYTTHHGKQKFTCKLCPKKFVRREQLIKHEKVHSSIKNYVCDTCNKGFVRHDKLKEHILRHLNVKRFQCGVCNKRYAENRNLKKHLRLHLKNK